MGLEYTLTPYTIFMAAAPASAHDELETIVADSANDAKDQYREEHDEWHTSIIVIGEAINLPQRRIAIRYTGAAR